MSMEVPRPSYEELFSAPDRDGAVISVRVHRSVKAALEGIAREMGLRGVSELVRYIIAGFLMGRLGIERPQPRVVTQPIQLNVVVARGADRGDGSVEEVEEVIAEVEDYLRKLRAGRVVPSYEYLSRLNRRVSKALRVARSLGLEAHAAKLQALAAELRLLHGPR